MAEGFQKTDMNDASLFDRVPPHDDDAERAARKKREENAHAERMAAINGATKVAVARAQNRPVYHIHWW